MGLIRMLCKLQIVFLLEPVHFLGIKLLVMYSSDQRGYNCNGES